MFGQKSKVGEADRSLKIQMVRQQSVCSRRELEKKKEEEEEPRLSPFI